MKSPEASANNVNSSKWPRLASEHLPPPTFWPAGLALAIAFIFWGLITSWVVFAVGVLQFTLSLVGWIADIRHEQRKHHS